MSYTMLPFEGVFSDGVGILKKTKTTNQKNQQQQQQQQQQQKKKTIRFPRFKSIINGPA